MCTHKAQLLDGKNKLELSTAASILSDNLHMSKSNVKCDIGAYFADLEC